MSIPESLIAALEDRYRIERPLGEGGMATVYLAQDVKHDRQVAIKVLKPELAAVVGGERFLAEIRTTANLQHPHILPLFDSGEADGFLYYVMPYISGETLRDRLSREKQLPVEEAVRLAGGVASALDYAHRQGVIHRDIKPANILLHEGEPLVADFGIALAVQQAGGGRLTETGLSLGTPYYMSPEQATGDRDPDARSDLYSLGCVTYEMLVGEPPFTGSTAQSVLAKILTGEAPVVTQARKSVPPNVASAVARATQRLPADRFETAAEFARALKDPGFWHGSVDSATPASGAGTTGGPWKIATGLLSVLVLVLAVAWMGGSGSGEGSPNPLALRVAMPDSQRVISLPEFPSVAISDDASTIAYVGPTTDGGRQLWVKRRSDVDPSPLQGTRSPQAFALSPDGSEVAFRLSASPALQVLSTSGGTARTVADTANPLGIHWGVDGFLYFQGSRSGLVRVPTGGGTAELLTKERLTEAGDPEIGDHAWPNLLPGERRVVFTLWGSTPEGDSIAVLDLDSREFHTIAEGVNARYLASGHLLVGANDQSLSVLPFDVRTGEVTGPLRAVASGVRAMNNGALDFATSTTGTLVYLSGGELLGYPAWVAMDGTTTTALQGWEGRFRSVRISPDGTRMAAGVSDGGREDVWVARLDRGGSPPQRITFDEPNVLRPIWLPGGDSIAYITGSTSEGRIMARRWDGTGVARTLLDTERAGVRQPIQGVAASRDGAWLAYRMGAGNSVRDIFGYDLREDSVGRRLVGTSANEHSPALSPDGRFLAYASNEAGTEEVYVQTFPDLSGGKWAVSARGGREPVWAPDGGTLYYRNGDAELMAAEWDVDGVGGVLSRRVLFDGSGFYSDPVHPSFDIDPDGTRFLMIRLVENRDPGIVWIEDFADGVAAAERNR